MKFLRRTFCALLAAFGFVGVGCREALNLQSRRPVLALSPEAASEVRRIIEENGIPHCYLRVRALPNGDGYQFAMEFDDTVGPDSFVFESSGVQCVVLNRQTEMLRGTLIEFGSRDGQKGFVFKNPNFEGDEWTKWRHALAQEDCND